MANPFAQKVSPEPRPRAPGRSPKRAEPARRSPRKAPRRPQGPNRGPSAPKPSKPAPRPSPKPKAPPGFGKPPAKPRVPFGKPQPMPAFPPGDQVVRRAANRVLKGMLPRLIPGLGWAMAGWDLYQLWLWYNQEEAPPHQFANHVPHCFTPDRTGTDHYYWSNAACYFDYNWQNWVNLYGTSTSAWRWLVRGVHPFNNNPVAGIDVERWYYPNVPPGTPVFNPYPVQKPTGIPVMPLPYPYPGAPSPYPRQPPLERPAPERYPAPEIHPVGLPPGVPSLDFSPDDFPRLGWHELRPPDNHEREKKKKLTKSQTDKWLQSIGGGYMEYDDVISAIYRGLNWRVRRWRGRDGVWRDRSITSASRLNDLYKHLPQLDVARAIENVIKQEATDRLIGQAGNQIKKATERAGQAGLYSGASGVGRGTPLNKQEWEARKKMMQDQYAADKAAGLHHNWYRKRVYDQATNTWSTKLVQRPDTQIPWLRYQSGTKTRRLTGGNDAVKTVVPRYYYNRYAAPQQGPTKP